MFHDAELEPVKMLERHVENRALVAEFFPDAGKIQGLCETSLTHLSHWTIQPLFHTARNGMAFSPLLSGLSGAYRDLSPDLSFLYLPSLNLPIQPLPCYPSSIDA